MWRGSSLSHIGAKWICSDCKKLWPDLASLKVPKHCTNCKGTKLFKSRVPLGLVDLQWWGAAHPPVAKAGTLHHCVLWVLVSQQRHCFPETFLLPPALISSSSVCAAKPHGPCNESFLGRKTPGCSARSPRAAVLPAFLLIGLSCSNAARNRSCSTCRDNVVGSFRLTRSELCKFKVFILLSQTWFLPIIFLQVSQYSYIPYGWAKNPVPKTDGANDGETIINANKIL